MSKKAESEPTAVVGTIVGMVVVGIIVFGSLWLISSTKRIDDKPMCWERQGFWYYGHQYWRSYDIDCKEWSNKKQYEGARDIKDGQL